MDVKEIIEQTTKEIKMDELKFKLVEADAENKAARRVAQRVAPDRAKANAQVRASKARMKEVNRPEVYQEYGPAPNPAAVQPDLTLSVEIGGQRIELCPECARRYLKI